MLCAMASPRLSTSLRRHGVKALCTPLRSVLQEGTRNLIGCIWTWCARPLEARRFRAPSSLRELLLVITISRGRLADGSCVSTAVLSDIVLELSIARTMVRIKESKGETHGTIAGLHRPQGVTGRVQQQRLDSASFPSEKALWPLPCAE
jgi:hypothetical protein